LNAAVNWRAKLSAEKLHCADFVPHLPKITAEMQNHGNGQKSRHMPDNQNFGDHGNRDSMIFLHPYPQFLLNGIY